MDLIDQIAEAHIQEAIERGELSDLPGEGEPLILDDDSMVPEELRAAYRLLKNAGFLPPEIQLRKQISKAEQLLRGIEDAAEYQRARAKLEWLRIQLGAARSNPVDFQIEEQYYRKLLERME